MGQLKTLLISSCLVALVAGAAIKAPEESSKADPKSVYSRALGPPGVGMGSISVPYMPKSPFFPKFVDPKMMITKKTDMLANLFGGLGPAMYAPGMTPGMQYGIGASGLNDLSAVDGKEEGPEKSGVAPWLQASGTEEEASMYKRGIFGPFTPKFGPMAPKFGPMSYGPFGGSPGADGPVDYSMDTGFSRKRRSVEEGPVPNLKLAFGDNKPDTANLGPPPAYPSLTPIPEEPEMGGLQAAAIPKEYLPGMFGPGGPMGPMVDPSMFISKKYTFLDTLFKNIATSTPPPATTDVPVPKSTIVPPSFWFPTSVVPSPADYNEKVSDFLDKLFENLNLTQTTTKEDEVPSAKRSVDTESSEGRIARSIQDLSAISAAKDTIVDTILSELEEVKNDMMSTMDDLIAYQKSTAAAASPIPKKPFKPFAPGMWPKPTIDATIPFKQRMTALGQVFDMLTELQKNITVAVQGAIEANSASNNPSEVPNNVDMPAVSADFSSAVNKFPVNLTLLDAIKQKLSSATVNPSGLYQPSMVKMGSKTARMVPQTPTSFWVSYPGSGTVKREVNEDSEAGNNAEDQGDRHQQFKRAVKMQMHQGYQNMPPGSVETVQAGGGSTPGQQGGGIKLLGSDPYGMRNKWFDWTQYVQNENEGRRHNHHHH